MSRCRIVMLEHTRTGELEKYTDATSSMSLFLTPFLRLKKGGGAVLKRMSLHVVWVSATYLRYQNPRLEQWSDYSETWSPTTVTTFVANSFFYCVFTLIHTLGCSHHTECMCCYENSDSCTWQTTSSFTSGLPDCEPKY